MHLLPGERDFPDAGVSNCVVVHVLEEKIYFILVCLDVLLKTYSTLTVICNLP